MQLIDREAAEKRFEEALVHVFVDTNGLGKKVLDRVPTIIDDQANLCDSCKYMYPACPADNLDIFFGNGLGKDNICICRKHEPIEDTVNRK